jgi:probable HAF family extracellular repeat protein
MGQVDGQGISQFINHAGVVVGGLDTTAPDPYCLNKDCFIPHAFRWQGGVLTDLGSLPGVNFSHATSVNSRGWATGGSFTSNLDPLTGQPAEHAVVWKGGKIVDLGTLGTGLESAGLYVNDAGEIVGFSTWTPHRIRIRSRAPPFTHSFGSTE